MADSFIRVPADSVGKRVDATSLDVGADTVYRQRIVIGSDTGTATFAEVLSASAAATSHGLVVRPCTATVVVASGTINVNGAVGISGTATVAGSVTISGTATVVNATASPLMIAALDVTNGTRVNVGDSANTALRVNVVAGAAGGVSQVDGTTFTSQAANFVPIGGIFDDAATDTLSENDAGVVRLTTARAFHINLRDAAGGGLGTAGNALAVNVHAISATASVILAAGTANIGTLNNISAAVTVTGLVGLTAGTSVIGDLNAISRTVQVAIGTPFTLNNISASVNIATGAVADFDISGAAVQNIPLIGIAQSASGGAVAWGGVVNISATATIVGVVNVSATASVILAAGTANFGTLNDISRTVQVAIGTPFTVNNISATVVVSGLVGLTAGTSVIGDLNAISRTVQVAVGTPFTVNNISATVTVTGSINLNATPAFPSASRGPRTVLVSTSSNATLVAAPGVGVSIHVTQLACSNASSTGTRARVGPSSSASTVQMFMGSAGGGFVMHFDPPWKLSANEALLGSVKPNASEGLFNIHFYVQA